MLHGAISSQPVLLPGDRSWIVTREDEVKAGESTGSPMLPTSGVPDTAARPAKGSCGLSRTLARTLLCRRNMSDLTGFDGMVHTSRFTRPKGWLQELVRRKQVKQTSRAAVWCP